MIAEMMPDLSHLSAEEREIIEQVFQRQRAEEQKEEEISQKADKELDDIEKIINDRKENAKRLVGTQNDAICQICQKTKFADGIGHKCFHCELRSCARCGGKTTHKNKSIWACSTCQKRQELFARSGKWFQSNQGAGVSPTNSQTADQPGGLENYAAEQEEQQIQDQEQMNGSDMPSSVSQQQLQNDRRRQSSIHKQISMEQVEPQKMNGSVHTNAQPMQPPLQQIQPQQIVNQVQPQKTHPLPQNVTPQVVQKPINSTQPRQPPNSTAHQQQIESLNQKPNVSKADIPRQQARAEPRIEEKSAQLKNQRSYDAHSVRSRTETMPDYTNGHSTSAVTSSRSPNSQINTTADPRVRQRTVDKITRHEAARQARHASQKVPSAVPPATSGMDPHNPHNQRSMTMLGGPGSRLRRGKLSRQIRSLSSSEDDDAQNAISRRHSAMEPDFSEKDLLKYIYGGQRIAKTNVHGFGVANSLPGSRTGLYDAFSSTSNPALNKYNLTGNTLATKIRQFLQQPVSWQPSADQRRLIGHIVLQRPETDSGDLGLKVIGGRHSTSGRLGAFITQVKSGSVADYVGQLRPGDEVLEWNGEVLQNLTHDGVYQIISASKNSPKIELIVSRSAQSPPIAEDYLASHRTIPQQQSPVAHSDYGASSISHSYISDHYRIPHSKSLVNPQMAYMQDSIINSNIHKQLSPQHRGQNLGKLEFSLLYLSHEHELLITVYQAVDLPPRSTGVLRNPYVKVFLLPNRSEESRRQSKILYETLNPAWNECFFYYGISTSDLNRRALEITVWDYDQYNGHEFIGETVIDLSQILLDNQHFSYPLVDMDDENPLRLRLRQSRMNSPYTHPQERYRSQSASCDDYRQGDLSHRLHQMAIGPSHINYGYPRDVYEPDSGYRSKYDEMEWNGYLSDHGQYQRPPNSYYHRRPRSATGFRHIADYEARSNTYRNQPITEEAYDEENRISNHQPKTYNDRIPNYQQSESQPQQQQYPNNINQQPPPHSNSPSHHPNHQQQKNRIGDGMEFMSNRQRELIMQEQSGYGSDGSETLSANSAQSMQKRAANREEEQLQANLQDIPAYSPRHHFYENPANSSSTYPQEQQQSRYGHRQQSNNQRMTNEMGYKMNNGNGRMDENQRLNGGQEIVGQQTNGAGSGSNLASGPGSVGALSMKERKKSLMTRLIPGRNAPSDMKRTGFARSEEVGIPDTLSVNQNGDPDGVAPFLKQSSKDSTDSSHSDNFQPVLPEGTLGQFVDNLGPGQVVGRQALASPVLGEIQICLYMQDGALIVDIKRAKNLVIRPGTKINPAPYCKVYLMQNKQCVAKAKTQAVRKTTAPIFNQKLSFAESYKHRMLQITVLGDYGRMERKSFMGIAQIRLDDLPLGGSHVVDGWYKLFHNTSLAGTAPVRKDSENSLMEM